MSDNNPLDMGDDERSTFRRMLNDYLRTFHSSGVPAPRPDTPTVQRDGVRVADYDAQRTFAGRYMGDWDGDTEHGDVQIVAADLLAAIERGDMLVITPGCAPAQVAAELRRMFGGDPVWWDVFRREVEPA